jgi:hypothetical protein
VPLVLINDFTYTFYTGIRAFLHRARYSAHGSNIDTPINLPPTSQPVRSSPAAKPGKPSPKRHKKEPQTQIPEGVSLFLSQPKPSDTAQTQRRHTQLRVGCYQVSSPNWLVCSRWMVRGKQTETVATESSDPSFLHACILATHAFPPPSGFRTAHH